MHLLNHVQDSLIVNVHNLVVLNALLSVGLLLEFEGVLVEILLQLLIGI